MPVSCDQMGHDGRRWGRREEWPRYERTGMRYYSTLRSACDLPQRSFGDVACAQDGTWHSHKYEAARGRRFQGAPAAAKSGETDRMGATFSPRYYIRHQRQRWRLAGKNAAGPDPAPWIALAICLAPLPEKLLVRPARSAPISPFPVGRAPD